MGLKKGCGLVLKMPDTSSKGNMFCCFISLQVIMPVFIFNPYYQAGLYNGQKSLALDGAVHGQVGNKIGSTIIFSYFITRRREKAKQDGNARDSVS